MLPSATQTHLDGMVRFGVNHRCAADHAVLDMCASPGSKTRQLLEAMKAGHAGSISSRGVVIANDCDEKRCATLLHQIRYSGTSHCIVTNHPAQRFPTIRTGSGRSLEFDRILCDVPCSGDGTMRKAPDLWRRWRPESGSMLPQCRHKNPGSQTLCITPSNNEN